MFWATLWALVLGFGLSGAVQAFVSRGEMERVLGNHRPATVARASILGAISSSCSYAASALAKTLFVRGADWTTSMVFMVASTNLVVELGIVLWLLIGWQFAVAEFVGGTIMIVLLAIVLPRVISATELEAARARLKGAGGAAASEGSGGPEPWRTRIRSAAGWSDAAGYTVSDLRMLRRELLIGFVVAGFLSELVPERWWHSIFLSGHGFGSSAENVVLGPFIALISFVCSVGNVPLAAALWKGGISFGGTVAFVFADLISLPLLAIARRYYGTRITLRMLAVFWAAMSVAGLATEYLFKAAGLVPTVHPRTVVTTGFGLDATLVLNVVAIVAFGAIYWLYRNRARFGGPSGYARDPVCGMQVEVAHAPAVARVDTATYYFCCDRCHDRFVSEPERYLRSGASPPAPPPPPASPVAVTLGRKPGPGGAAQ